MTFLYQRKNNSRRTFFITIGLIAFLLIIIGKVDFVSSALSRTALSVATPVWRAESYLMEQGNEYALKLRSKDSLIKENKRLHQENAALKVGFITKDLLVQENKELKERLGRYDTDPASLLAAVLAKPNRSPYDTLIIDAGRNHSVEVGDRVTAYGESAIGTVEVVMRDTARVKLFSSPGEEIDVAVGEQNISAVAVGAGSGNFTVDLPRGIDVEEGALISFPSMNSTVVGVVETIQVQPSDSFQRLLFKNPVNMYELKWVEVLITSQ